MPPEGSGPRRSWSPLWPCSFFWLWRDRIYLLQIIASTSTIDRQDVVSPNRGSWFRVHHPLCGQGSVQGWRPFSSLLEVSEDGLEVLDVEWHKLPITNTFHYACSKKTVQGTSDVSRPSFTRWIIQDSPSGHLRSNQSINPGKPLADAKCQSPTRYRLDLRCNKA